MMMNTRTKHTPEFGAKGVSLLLASLLAVSGCGGELPVVVRDEMAMTSRAMPGAATVVFFTDFQCPHCRRTHAALAPLVAERAGRVRVVLRHVPLPRHPDAQTAARAAVCVEAMTPPATPEVFDTYVHALFASVDLSPLACKELASARGLDADRLERCMSDPATDARIERDVAMFDAVGGDGVPLLFIGRTRFEGAQTAQTLEVALDREIARK